MKTFLAGLTLALLVALDAPATAKVHKVTKSYPVAITCVTTGQTCEPAYATEFTTTGGARFRFTHSRSACAPIWIHYRVDGAPSNYIVAGAVYPGKTIGVSFGPVLGDTHLLEIRAEGAPQDCNTGTLSAWAGKLRVTTSKRGRR